MDEPDFKCYDIEELDMSKLDPGIRDVVAWLVSKGYKTVDSGDGKHKLGHDWGEHECELIPYPHVFIQVDPKEAVHECHRLVALLGSIGHSPVVAWTEEGKPHIEMMYDPMDEVATIGVFNLTGDMVPK